MPCWEVRRMTLELEAADRDLLRAAIQALGYDVRQQGAQMVVALDEGDAVIEGSSIRVPAGSEVVVNQIKQAYSRQVLTAAAKRFGWQVNTAQTNHLTLKRRGV
jgi:hypothetical protein